MHLHACVDEAISAEVAQCTSQRGSFLYTYCFSAAKYFCDLLTAKIFISSYIGFTHCGEQKHLYKMDIIYMYTCTCPEAARQLIFLRKSDCLGCAVLLCLVVCLTLLASFFLPSHISCTHIGIPCSHGNTYMYHTVYHCFYTWAQKGFSVTKSANSRSQVVPLPLWRARSGNETTTATIPDVDPSAGIFAKSNLRYICFPVV